MSGVSRSLLSTRVNNQQIGGPLCFGWPHATDGIVAATAFARAWNRLDPEAFLELLAPDAHYASRWVFEELGSRAAIARYLRGKMKTVRNFRINNPGHRARAELTTCGDGRHCVAMTQGDHDEVKAVVVFTVSGNRIARYDMCMPELMGPLRSGVFPI